MKSLVLVAVGLALSACEASSIRPAPAVATVAFAVPSGDVQLTTSGVVDLGTQSVSTQGVQALHLRMRLTNDSEWPWTVDTREQRIDLEGYGTSAPAFASSDAGSPPVVTIAPGAARDVNLYFPLPAALADRATLPVFDVLWDVHTADGVLARRTPFEQIAVEQAPWPGQPGEYSPEWGGSYWYNPDYAQHEFTGGVVIPPFYFGVPLYVHRHRFGNFAPRGRYHARGGEDHERGAVVRPRGEEHGQRDQRDWVRGREETPSRRETPREATPHGTTRGAAPHDATPHNATPPHNATRRPVPRIEQRTLTRPMPAPRAIPRAAHPAHAPAPAPTTPAQPQHGDHRHRK